MCNVWSRCHVNADVSSEAKLQRKQEHTTCCVSRSARRERAMDNPERRTGNQQLSLIQKITRAAVV